MKGRGTCEREASLHACGVCTCVREASLHVCGAGRPHLARPLTLEVSLGAPAHKGAGAPTVVALDMLGAIHALAAHEP